MPFGRNKQFSTNNRRAKNKKYYEKYKEKRKKQQLTFNVTCPQTSNSENGRDAKSNITVHKVSPVVQVNNATTGNTNLVNTSNQELKNGTLNAPFQSSIQQSSSPQSSFLIFLKKQAIKYFYYKQYSDLLDAHVDISLCVEDCAKLIGVEGWAEKE